MKKIISLLTLLLIASISFSQSSLVGIYSVKEQGRLNEFIKIEKKGNSYMISEKQNGSWGSAKTVTSVSKSSLEKMLKESVKVAFTGLGNNDIALIQVSKGWTSGTFRCNTGYWLASMLGPIELYKK